MVNTLFAGKVMFVNQVIITLGVCCHRLAGSGVKWQLKIHLTNYIRLLKTFFIFIQVEDDWTKDIAIKKTSVILNNHPQRRWI